MGASQIDRINGLVGSIAMKAPCRVATTANIALRGFQTIDGVVLDEDDDNKRVAVVAQTNPVDNGIYEFNSGAWQRAADFDGARDVTTGTLLQVIAGTGVDGAEITFYKLITPGPIRVGETALEFSKVVLPEDFVAEFAEPGGSALIGFLQAGTGAVARTAQSKLRDVVSVFDFMTPAQIADATSLVGAIDSTAAWNAALAAGRVVEVPAGAFKIGALNAFPSTLRSIQGAGSNATLIVVAGAVTVSDSILKATSRNDLSISGFSLNLNITTYPTNRGIQLTTCNRCKIEDVTFPQAGAVGVRLDGCSDVAVRKVTTTAYVDLAIHSVNSGQRIEVSYCKLSGTGTSHACQIQGGGEHDFHHNYTNGARHFGFSGFQCAGIRCVFNQFDEGRIEGCNMQDCTFFYMDYNKVFQSQTLGTDFGISAFGDPAVTGNCYHGSICHNEIYLPYKSGIALAARVKYVQVAHNRIISPNRENVVEGAGVILYGPECQNNDVRDNFILDQGSRMRWGVNEWNDGSGVCTNNNLGPNDVTGASLGEVNLLSSGSRAWDKQYASYALTLAASTGATTSYTVNSAKYKRSGKSILLRFDVSITNAGTGSVSYLVSLPVAAATRSGVLSGRDIDSTSAMLAAICSGASATVVKYDGTFPSGTARLTMSGTYEAA